MNVIILKAWDGGDEAGEEAMPGSIEKKSWLGMDERSEENRVPKQKSRKGGRDWSAIQKGIED